MSHSRHNQASTLFDELINSADQEETVPEDTDSRQGSPADKNNLNDTPSEQTNSTHSEPAHLEPAAKRAVVRLMRQGVITARQNPKLFDTLNKYKKPIQLHLSNMYLKITLDTAAGLAILQEQVEEDLQNDSDDPVSLITHRSLSLYDTLLLLVLRKYFQERESAGEQQIFIDIEQVESLLTPFLPLTNSSRSDRRLLNGALEKMKERKIVSFSKDDDRFEITAVIRYVVNADFLKEMHSNYLSLAEDFSPEPSSSQPEPSLLKEANHD